MHADKRLCGEPSNANSKEFQYAINSEGEPDAYAGTTDIHDDIARRRYSVMTKELISLDAEGSGETQEGGVEERSTPWQKASNAQVADRDESDKIQSCLSYDRRVKTEMGKRKPLDIAPMRAPVKLRPWQTDDKQHA